MRPFFSFYGGKWRDAPNYPEPTHGTIVEPFAGSAGYATRYPSRRVILCDLDPIIAGIWRYLISVSPAEVLALPDVPEGGAVHELDLPQGARSLVGFWLNRGSAGPCNAPSAWMRAGKHPTSFWGAEIRERIASQVGQVRHWEVIEGPYTNAPDITATWFVDPPYQVAGTHYRCSSRDLDFDALGGWCRARQGQTIVCENEGATWLPFRHHGSMKTARRGRRSAEVIWTRNCLRQGAFEITTSEGSK
ncbi:MAG: hypothetical protein ACI9MR_000033 [Myxococcota bacterium]|jgi:hypothetical protein